MLHMHYLDIYRFQVAKQPDVPLWLYLGSTSSRANFRRKKFENTSPTTNRSPSTTLPFRLPYSPRFGRERGMLSAPTRISGTPPASTSTTCTATHGTAYTLPPWAARARRCSKVLAASSPTKIGSKSHPASPEHGTPSPFASATADVSSKFEPRVSVPTSTFSRASPFPPPYTAPVSNSFPESRSRFPEHGKKSQ